MCCGTLRGQGGLLSCTGTKVDGAGRQLWLGRMSVWLLSLSDGLAQGVWMAPRECRGSTLVSVLTCECVQREGKEGAWEQMG